MTDRWMGLVDVLVPFAADRQLGRWRVDASRSHVLLDEGFDF